MKRPALPKRPLLPAPISALVPLLLPALLSACGGSTDGSGNAAAPATSTSITLTPLAADVASAALTPHFSLAPVVLAAPADLDSQAPSASALQPAATQAVPAALAATSTTRLTPLALAANPLAAAPAASGSTTVTTYTPAQIRAGYGLPALPASWTGLSASVAAQMGAGQTVYIVDAMSDPNIAAELAAFSQKFGLPGCTTTAIASGATLPLPAASTGGCQFSVVNATSSGAMTSIAPPYDSGWATEIALDVQWVHATAPLARIILIQASNASTASLLGAINLANAMGPGVISMSFGAAEGSWTSSVDSAFTRTNMTYMAATGDSGTGVEWPSVSKNVLGVGGTHLVLNGSTRTESVWSGTGGGISQYTTVPSYQTPAVPGVGSLSMRSVADVAFNADPYTGQYVAVIPPGGSTASWYSVGGTSLATPQWAAIAAIANALRAQGGKAPLGLAQTLLYGNVGANAGAYAAAFSDITQGSDGACATCAAHTGYDQPSGLGTPNVSSLLASLTANAQPPAPVVTPVTVNGTAGSALSFTMAVSTPDAVTWSLANAPAGMSVSAAGLISWPQPVAGSYAVTVTATDKVTGSAGHATATIGIAAPPAPVVEATTVAAQPGSALRFQVQFSASDPVTFALSGAPSGMTISSAGVLSWASPVAGKYSVTVTAKDTTTGKSGSAVLTVQVSTRPIGPVLSAAPIRGVAGRALSGVIGVSDPGASAILVRISGAPPSMTFAASGQGILLNWTNPVAGTYTLVLSATDSAGLSTQSTLVLTISAN